MLSAAEAHSGRLLGAAAEGEPLFIEFSALLTWLPGATLGWHDDVSAGPHLAHRHVSASVYLSSGDGVDFDGGCLEARDGEETSTFTPQAGECLIFASTVQHRVTPVLAGRRAALQLWLTRNGAAAEDIWLLAALARAGPQTLPSTLFCADGGRGEDGRAVQLARLGLRLRACDSAEDAVWLESDDGDADACRKLAFADASEALAVAVHAQAMGTALSTCHPYSAAGRLGAAEVAMARSVAAAAGRAAVAAALPRWQRAGALFS